MIATITIFQGKWTHKIHSQEIHKQGNTFQIEIRIWDKLRHDKGAHCVLEKNFRLNREQIFTILPHRPAIAKRTCGSFLTPKGSHGSRLAEKYR